jgi:hypothetical protein
MPTKSFNELYQQVSNENTTRRIHLEQLDEQMKASVLLSELRE